MRQMMDLETGEIFSMVKICGKTAHIGKKRKEMQAFTELHTKTGALWTIGTNWTIEEFDKLQAAWDKFARTLKGDWIAVVEAGSSGGRLHLHILYSQFEYWKAMKENWEKAVGKQKLHVDVKRFWDLENNKAIVRYLTKYLTKSKMSGRRTYRKSQGLRDKLEPYLVKSEEGQLWKESQIR